MDFDSAIIFIAANSAPATQAYYECISTAHTLSKVAYSLARLILPQTKQI